MKDPKERTDEEWRQILDEQSYQVLRRKATERPFTGEYNDEKRKGMYRCKGCGAPLFSSDAKFDSGCGWSGGDSAPERKMAFPDWSSTSM